MASEQSEKKFAGMKGRLLLLAALLLLLYVVVPRISSFSDSFTVVRQAHLGYVAGATVLLCVTFICAAGVYWFLALKPVAYRQILLVQMASAFTSRLLPAGLGTMTLFVQYLRKSKHRLPEAIAVVSLNNLAGLMGHMVVLAVVVAAVGFTYPTEVQLPKASTVWLILCGIVAVIAVNLLVFRRLRQYAFSITKDVARSLRLYKKQPQKIAGALGVSVLMTLCFVGIFYACCLGVGVEASVSQIFMVFTMGLIAGTATPTPGGLIGVEAGLTGGLIAYGVQADTALAAALLYRFLTYWLPLLPGFIIFLRIRRLYS